MIDADYAKEIGLSVTDSVKVQGFAGVTKNAISDKNTINLGNTSTKNMDFTIVQKIHPSKKVKGFLGGTFLKEQLYIIDYEKQKLFIFKNHGFTYNGAGTILKANYFAGIPVLDASIFMNGEKIKGLFIVDTGASQTIICNPWVNNKYELIKKFKKSYTKQLYGYGGNAFKVTTGRSDSLKLGSKLINRVPIESQIASYSNNTSVVNPCWLYWSTDSKKI